MKILVWNNIEESKSRFCQLTFIVNCNPDKNHILLNRRIIEAHIEPHIHRKHTKREKKNTIEINIVSFRQIQIRRESPDWNVTLLWRISETTQVGGRTTMRWHETVINDADLNSAGHE